MWARTARPSPSCETRQKLIHAILAQTVLQVPGISLALFSQNIFIYRHRIGLIKIICENISLNTIVESHIQYLQIIQLTLLILLFYKLFC